jgi:hypothetical protein
MTPLSENGHQMVNTRWPRHTEFNSTGPMPLFRLGQLWKAKAEPKVKLFGWKPGSKGNATQPNTTPLQLLCRRRATPPHGMHCH